MPSFDEAWNAVAHSRKGGPVSPELRPLLQAVYSQLLFELVNPAKLKNTLKDLLGFLAVEGRTNANCWAVDLFFANAEGWERDWGDQNLPDEIEDILAKMSQALHDTVQAPDIAENFGCLPEQLLEEVEALPEDPNSPKGPV